MLMSLRNRGKKKKTSNHSLTKQTTKNEDSDVIWKIKCSTGNRCSYNAGKYNESYFCGIVSVKEIEFQQEMIRNRFFFSLLYKALRKFTNQWVGKIECRKNRMTICRYRTPITGVEIGLRLQKKHGSF